MATYIALTTTNAQQNGFEIIAAGPNKAKVEEAAKSIIGTGDIYRETEQKNLVVVSKTAAKRNYGIDWAEFYPDYANPINRYAWID